MESTDEPFSNTDYEPKDYFLTETYVESLTVSLTEQRLPEQRFTEDVDYDDAALEEMLFNAQREQVYHSQRERLSDGQSSSSVSDRSGQPVVEIVTKNHERSGQPVVERGQEQNIELNTHRLCFFWTDRGSKSSPIVRRRLRDTSSSLIMTEEVYKI